MKLREKVAIVTGAGRGLGRAIALALSREGAGVSLVSRSRQELEEVAAAIGEENGESLAIACDVSDESGVRGMVDETLRRFSTVDILVNNAAILGPAGFLSDTDAASWKAVMEININGVFHCIRAVMPVFSKKRQGKIVNITSGLGQRPYPRFCAYGVSKAAVNQMTRSLAEELKPLNIQVNAIDPGVMETRMQDEIRGKGKELLGDEVFDRFRELKETGSLKDPAVVAPLAVYLASSESDHLSGRIGTLEDYRALGWEG